MAWSRRWRIDSRGRLLSVLSALTHTLISERAPLELILRTERKDKTVKQRNLFHAVMADLAPQLGLTPGETKQLVKEEFYGFEVRKVFGVERKFVQSSEDSDREEYVRLTDFAYQFSAEHEIYIPDRRSTNV